MQTHLFEKLQENSYLLRKLWQAFLMHMLESLRKPMSRRENKEITADSKVYIVTGKLIYKAGTNALRVTVTSLCNSQREQ